jgi:signal transduction histidine kinase
MRNNFRLSTPLRFTIGIVLIIGLSLGVFDLLMSPPKNDIRLMAGFLSITAVFSGLAGYIAYRLGWMERWSTIRSALLGGYALASLLTFVNVWVTARLMFASDHDLMLATVLLLFAGGMAMALGYLLASALTDRISLLDQAARSLAEGNLAARVPVNGRDEMSNLANSFNQMAEQLQSAAQQQREVERLRRDLIAWVGHDLQTPLASIRAIVEALADGVLEEQAMIHRYLETAQRDIRSLSVLIDDLFQMAQLDAGGLTLNCSMNSLSDLISDTIESFSELADRQGVTLTGQVGENVDPIYMDAPRIGRVLNNLVSNALRHTPFGGQVHVSAQATQHEICVEISDTGEGVSPVDIPHIFERFYRSEKSRNRSTGGAGLGLAIAKGIVQAHGGQIGVESHPGRTLFFFTIPGQSIIYRQENQ